MHSTSSPSTLPNSPQLPPSTSIPKLIAYLSSIMRLEVGDFILTGTPAGVGPIKIGDTITAGLGHDYMSMRFRVVQRPSLLSKF
jgi:acylpyruvate hydrolase